MNTKNHKLKTKCQQCGKCCIALTQEIEQPKTTKDFQDLFWYLYHQNITLAIDNENKWVMEINTRCKHLNKNNQCKIHKNRPPICRIYLPNQCPNNTKEFKHHFKTEKQLEKYLKQIKKV